MFVGQDVYFRVTWGYREAKDVEGGYAAKEVLHACILCAILRIGSNKSAWD